MPPQQQQKMLPPPSPGMKDASKDGVGGVKVDGSPGTAPTTPAPTADPFGVSTMDFLDQFSGDEFSVGGDINFERDFGQWFNHPDDVGAALDLK